MNQISASPQDRLPPLRHPWSSCITVGRAYELLRADLQEHLRFLKRELGYRHIRFHASFHDDVNVVQRATDGTISYRWTQLDHIYDFLVDAGFAPVVEINPMPAALASGDKTMFWYKMNVTPPASYDEWNQFINTWITHVAERYGSDTVRDWYFEVWNEPDLRDSFWTGTMADYYTLYEQTARTLKAFDPTLRLGGPATAAAIDQVLPFAEWCRAHSVPLDFLSYHNYPQNEATRFPCAAESPSQPGMYLVDSVRETKAELERAGFGALPLLMTEWNTQAQNDDWVARWAGNEHVNDLFSGAAVCHLAHGCDQTLDMMAFWVASDVFEEGGPQLEPYGTRYQYYGMLTVDGIPKPAFHAFRFLSKMRGERYQLSLPSDTSETRGAVVTDEKSTTRALIWNCAFPTDEIGEWVFSLRIPLAAVHKNRTAVRVCRAHIRAGQGSGYEYWKAMGAPATLTNTEQQVLAARSQPAWSAEMVEVMDGTVALEIHLEPNETLFLEVGGDPEGDAAEQSHEVRKLNQDLMT